jgi:glyoxylase-like metal-dependent hydrolase (beta-lactamase superfamily II)
MAAIYRFKVGDFECIAIQDASMNRAASQVFPSIAAEERERVLRGQGTDPEAMPWSINILYVNTGNHHILVDTSIDGNAMPGAGQLKNTLQSIGIEPDSIDHIIITHGHRDHIGGLMGEDGQPVYPNARISMLANERDHWFEAAQKAENPDEAAKRNLLPLRDKIDVVTTESEILPGVCLIPAPGHTLGHTAVLFQSQGEGLVHVVDAMHQPVQIENPHWTPMFDVRPDLSVPTRKALMERAANEHTLLMAYHFAFPGVGRITKTDTGFGWQPIQPS